MLADLQKKVLSVISENASAILTAGGVVGTVGTAVLAGRAAVKAHSVIETAEEEASIEESHKADRPIDIKLTKTEKMIRVWPLYIPPVIAGGATIGSIVMANRMSAQKAAALAAAYGLSEKQFREYKEKVTQKLSPKQDQQLKDELAQDRVNNTPGYQNVVIVDGDVICFDEYSGRYFRGSMEKMQRAANKANEQILNHGYVDLEYFYSLLDLPETVWASTVGWNMNGIIDLVISTTQTPEGKPCLAMDFRVRPTQDYTDPVHS